MNDLNGKVAVVTGAGKGIGQAVATRLAAAGTHVVVADIDVEAAQAVAGRLDSAVAVETDVRVPEHAERAVQTAIAEFGRLDLLLSNAGVVRYGEVADLSVDDWDLMLDTNLKGGYLVARAAVPRMREGGGGSIVFTASVQAVASQMLVAAYAASKGGLVSLTKTMALDHRKDHIRVNCVLPGAVRTPMLRYAADLFVPDSPVEAMESWGASQVNGLIEPEEVAGVITFLCSSDARSITGSAYTIDGGLLAGLAL